MYRFLKFLVPSAALVLLAAVVVVSAVAISGQDEAPPPAAEPQAATAVIPESIHYQGFLLDDVGDPVDGPVNLQFDLFQNASGGISLWNQTSNNVDVDQGYFAVELGPITVEDLRLPQGASTLYIQVSILPDGGGQVSLPRQPLASAPYSFLSVEAAAAPWDGLTGVPPGFADNIDDIDFQNVVTVAKSNAQFTSIQEAIDSITDADTDNRYLVWIGPGRYVEQVITKPFVYLLGAGEWLTWIVSGVSNEDVYPPVDATLHLADHANVRDLTVHNTGDGFRNVAILAPDGTQSTALENVSALVNGPGDVGYGILLFGANTGVQLRDVSSQCYASELPDSVCVALEVSDGAAITVHSGRYGAYNGNVAVGIIGRQPETRVELFDVTVEAADSADTDIGLILNEGAVGNLSGGRFEARNAFTSTHGILLYSDAAVEANGVIALGHDSPGLNHGLTLDTSRAGLYNGAFTGFGGQEAMGILSIGGTLLEATGVRANAEAATNINDGVRVTDTSQAMFNGGYFSGRGGGVNRGMVVETEVFEGATLDVQNAEIQGEGGDGFGVSNELSGVALVTLSEVYGSANAVMANGAFTRVHLSRLTGGAVTGGGSVVCVAVTYDDAFYADSCP